MAAPAQYYACFVFIATASPPMCSAARRICGEHLIGQRRRGPDGRRSWVAQGFGLRALNGMSHGAAGFAYALTSLAAVTGREDLPERLSNALHLKIPVTTAERKNWPDLRMDPEPAWPCQWCHGAPGIGLARIGMAKRAGLDATQMTTDIRNAIESTRTNWPAHVDTLCCGTLGSIEFFCEAASAFARRSSRARAAALEGCAGESRTSGRLPMEYRRKNNSILACFVVLQVWAIRCCVGSKILSPTS